MNPGGGGGPRRPVRGFRPGKEPPQIRKRRAMEQYGAVSGSQERLLEMFAERTPEQARSLLRRWRVGLLTAAVSLLLLGGLLFLWSVVAGIVVEVLALAALVLWWRIRGQRGALEAMVDAASGPGGGRAGKRKGGKKQGR